MEKTYTITLSDGTAIENLSLNGTNYISQTPVNPEVFSGNCSPMIISDGENNELHMHAELIQIIQHNNEYWIAFRDIPKQELESIKLRSDIDYIAMMTDTDLNDFEEV